MEKPMRRFSKCFWFTVLAGTLSSALFYYALLRIFTAQSDSMLALIRAGSNAADLQALPRLYHVTVAAIVIGTPLLFWLAYRFAPARMKAPASAADAAQ